MIIPLAADGHIALPTPPNRLVGRERELAALTKLLEDDRTRFVGVRGLMRQRIEAGDTRTALKLAEKAYALKPRQQELQETLLQLQAQAHDWKGARGVLKDKRRLGQLPKDVHTRRDAILALQEAREVLEKGASISAREAAISANRASPDLIPAAVLAARSYIAQKDSRNASRVLQKTWQFRPHPSLAAAYAEIVPDETPAQRLSRFEDLLKQNPDNSETRLLRAELALAAEDFPGARRALGDLAQTDPTVRSLAIMAAIERGEGADDSVVRGWLTRALTASRGPQWVCDKCQNVMADWSPICDSCGAFDTLTWRRVDHDHAPSVSTTGAEMLPLIVGRPSAAPDSPEAAQQAAGPVPAIIHTAARSVAPVAAPATREVATVAPGMVPRETDYVVYEPSATVTTPEREVVLVRPDVEPLDEDKREQRL